MSSCRHCLGTLFLLTGQRQQWDSEDKYAIKDTDCSCSQDTDNNETQRTSMLSKPLTVPAHKTHTTRRLRGQVCYQGPWLFLLTGLPTWQWDRGQLKDTVWSGTCDLENMVCRSVPQPYLHQWTRESICIRHSKVKDHDIEVILIF